MSKDHKLFEKVVTGIYEQLSKDCIVKHDDKINGRQIDVSIRTRVALVDLLIIVQCKAYKNKLDVTYVDELLGTMQDVGAHRGVLVSIKGFSAKAIQRAARCGIDLCVVRDAENRDWKLDLKIPVIYESIHPVVQFTCQINFKAGDKALPLEELVINGINPWKKFKEDWRIGNLNLENGQHIYTFDFVKPTVRLANGDERDVREVKVIYRINKNMAFGYIDDIPKTKYIHNISTNTIRIIVDEEEFRSYRKNFIRINSRTEAPVKNGIIVQVLDKPDMDTEMQAFSGYKFIGETDAPSK